jgi:hypothetical protein
MIIIGSRLSLLYERVLREKRIRLSALEPSYSVTMLINDFFPSFSLGKKMRIRERN